MAVNGSSFLLGLRIRGPLLELPNFDSYGQQVSDEELDYLLASSRAESLAWAATIGEILFGVVLIVGFKIRVTSILSGFLLLSFAVGMVTGLGVKTPFDYSVFSAAGAAFLLAFWEPNRFTLDVLLSRSRS
jgi:uncharacterized membrane protein YphA (DoxX/SURF4 family)